MVLKRTRTNTLEYLNLLINPNDLKIFLYNCKHVGLNKLLKNFTYHLQFFFSLIKFRKVGW